MAEDSYVVKMGLDPSDLVEGAKKAIDQINEIKKTVVSGDFGTVERLVTKPRKVRVQDPNARQNLLNFLHENQPAEENSADKELIASLKAELEDLKKQFADVREAYRSLAEGAQQFQKRGGEAMDHVVKRSVPLGRRLKLLRRQFAMMVYPVMGFLGVRKAFNEYLKGAESLDKFAKQAKVSISDLDAWSKATEAAGGSASAFQQALVQFVQSGKGSADEFFKLGDAYREVSEEQQDAWLKSNKLSKEAMEVFRLGADEAQELANSFRATAFTPEDAENARRFKIAWQQVSASMSAFGTMAIRLVMPAVNAISQGVAKLADFARKHFRVFEISANLAGVALGVRLLANLKKLSLAFAAFGKSLWANPLTWYIAGLAALALALDDLWGFANGEDSLIEELFGGDTKTLEELRDSAKDLFSAFGDLWEAIKPLGGVLLFVGGIGLKVIAVLITLLARLILGVTDACKAIGDLFSKAWNGVKEVAKSVFDWIAEKFEWLSNIPFIKRWLASLKDSYSPPASGSNAESIAAAGATNTKNIRADTKVQITNNFTGADPKAVQEGMSKSATQASDLLGRAAVDAIAGQSA